MRGTLPVALLGISPGTDKRFYQNPLEEALMNKRFALKLLAACASLPRLGGPVAAAPAMAVAAAKAPVAKK